MVRDLQERLGAVRARAAALVAAPLSQAPPETSRGGKGAARSRRLGRGRRSARTSTAGEVIYVIGDVHGRLDLLEELTARVAQDAAGSPHLLILCGDYIDRGPAAAEVLEWVLRLKKHGGGQVRLLKGNHEQALLGFLDDPCRRHVWLQRFGGAATLESYGVNAPRDASREALEMARDDLLNIMPAAHLQLLQELETIVVRADYAFVHAGISPDAPLSEQTEADLLWARDGFLSAKGPFEKIIVHGHTWEGDRPALLDHRIGVDTGAYETGVLTAVRIVDEARHVIQALDATAALRRAAEPAPWAASLVRVPADYTAAPPDPVRSAFNAPSLTLRGRA
jgi:serine/threonine protein phosphatase 1